MVFLSGCGGSEDFLPLPPQPVVEPVPALVADPVRGERLFMQTPVAGQLICADCHSANPRVLNFGNIWAGRNAVGLIERAVTANTGGMGYLGRLYTAADFADIAAYLGNAPSVLRFDSLAVGSSSPSQTVSVSTSTKTGAAGFSARVIGDFQIASTSCAADLPRFDTCQIELRFAPSARGERSGALLISHGQTPSPALIALSGEGR